MTRNINLSYALLAGFFLFCHAVIAHGELSLRIAEKTEQIEQDSTNAILYFERGFLYHQHEEYEAAIHDYGKSEALGLKSEELYFRKAETYFTASFYAETLQTLEQYFHLNAADVKGRKLYAKTLYQLRRFDEAYREYQYVILNISDPRPEDYLIYSEISQFHFNHDPKAALRVINNGLEVLGHDTVTLQLKRLELLKETGSTDKVIEQYNYFLSQTNRKEFWYFRKASFLNGIGRDKDAKIALQQAKVAISLLRQKFKNTEAIINLKSDVALLENTLNYDD